MCSKTAEDLAKSPFQKRFYRDVSNGPGYVSCFFLTCACITSRRVVQGVRQWIRSNPPTDRPKRHPNKTRTEAMVPKAHTVTPQDKLSTEALALQLLDPSVSEDERDEYQGYGWRLPGRIVTLRLLTGILINVKCFQMHMPYEAKERTLVCIKQQSTFLMAWGLISVGRRRWKLIQHTLPKCISMN